MMMPRAANHGPPEKGDAVGGVFGAGELAVGEARVGIDGGVDVGVTETGPVAGDGSPSLLVATPWGDAGQLLDVDVDQLTGTHGVDPTHDPPGGAVHPGQPVEAVADQDPMHRRGRHAHDPGQPGWSEPAGLAQRHDAPLEPGRGLVRTGVRAAGAVHQARLAGVLVAAPPLVGALPGDVHRLRRGGNRPALDDAVTKPKPAFGSERSVTVHLGPPGASVLPSDSSTLTPEAHPRVDVNNVPGRNS